MKSLVTGGLIILALGAIGLTLYKAVYKTPTLPEQPLEKIEIAPAPIAAAAAATAPADTSDKVKEITTKAELDSILEKNPVTIVKLSATWCPPCKVMKPIYSRLSADHGDKMAFIEIDIDQFENAQIFNARGIPAFIIYKNGKEHSRIIGSRTQDELKTEFLKAL